MVASSRPSCSAKSAIFPGCQQASDGSRLFSLAVANRLWMPTALRRARFESATASSSCRSRLVGWHSRPDCCRSVGCRNRARCSAVAGHSMPSSYALLCSGTGVCRYFFGNRLLHFCGRIARRERPSRGGPLPSPPRDAHLTTFWMSIAVVVQIIWPASAMYVIVTVGATVAISCLSYQLIERKFQWQPLRRIAADSSSADSLPAHGRRKP